MEQLMLFDERITDLKKFVESERGKHELWAFLEGHGGKTGFNHGYLQCLNDIEKLLK